MQMELTALLEELKAALSHLYRESLSGLSRAGAWHEGSVPTA
jgi:hypothetical protein